MARWFIILLAALSCAAPGATAAGKATHIVVVVWDGLRPDSVNKQNTPTLHKLAKEGVFFQNHHAVYPSSTQVNGVAMATGAYPNRNGIIANREYRPEIDPLKHVDTEAPEVARRGDELSRGGYLRLLTLAEILQRAGRTTAIAGAKPIVLLHNRFQPERIKLLDTKRYETPNERQDAAATRALVGPLWDNGVPTFSLLWLSEPDLTQHAAGCGSGPALKAHKISDRHLALVLDELQARGLRDKTDIFVVSDHGFSTIQRTVDVAEVLQKAGFNAARQFPDPPGPGSVMVVGNGGTVLLYVIGHDAALTRRLVDFLQHQDFTGVIFTRAPMPGTFTLDQIRLNSLHAPDIVVSLRWSPEKNAAGIAGLLTNEGTARRPGQGAHASLSPFDMRATLVAAGPDFRRGMVNQLPSGNADLAPTILHLLGITPPQPMDGRVLLEALQASAQAFPPIETRTLETSRDFDSLRWQQYLRLTEFAGAIYFHEGNGAQIPK